MRALNPYEYTIHRVKWNNMYCIVIVIVSLYSSSQHPGLTVSYEPNIQEHNGLAAVERDAPDHYTGDSKPSQEHHKEHQKDVGYLACCGEKRISYILKVYERFKHSSLKRCMYVCTQLYDIQMYSCMTEAYSWEEGQEYRPPSAPL